jgi:hypothetical protein
MALRAIQQHGERAQMKPDVRMKEYDPGREHGTSNGALRWIHFKQDCQGYGGQWPCYQGLKPALPIEGTELLVHVMKFVLLPQQTFVLESVVPVEEKIKNERG